MEPQPTFWPLDQRKPLLPWYLMKRYVFEQVYWHLMPIGRWFGKRMIFEHPVVHKKPGAAQAAEATVAAVMPSAHLALQAEVKVAHSTEHGVEGEAGSLKPMLLGVETPPVPGNISLAGSLPKEAVAALAPRYKGWLYLNPSDHPDFHREAIEAAGCKLINVHLPGAYSGGVPEKEHATKLLEAMRELPRPLMVQCTSGNRSSAALLLWLAKKTGRSAAVTQQLADDLDLRLNKCTASGPIWEWLEQEIGEVPRSFRHHEETKYVLDQLFDSKVGSSTFTYLIGCAETKEAVLIDPVLGLEDRDLGVLKERGLKLKYIVNTHCHADHVTSGAAIKKLLPEVKTVISKASGAQADIHIAHGDKVEFGATTSTRWRRPATRTGACASCSTAPASPRPSSPATRC
eukprot:SRR837773.6309.p1 GENE.SRR837773.6309~~SRR837773.6309.p1  ORF type:complete len:420 (-),score=179.66 SRR837773.6309:485-1690(-)